MSEGERSVVGTGRAQVDARLLDLSLGGALLLLTVSLDEGVVHDFALNLEGETISVQAQVKRCRPAVREPGYEVAVEFVGIAPAHERRLREYLDRP